MYVQKIVPTWDGRGNYLEGGDQREWETKVGCFGQPHQGHFLHKYQGKCLNTLLLVILDPMVPGSNPGWCKLLREGTIRKGGRSESGKPKLAPLASHTKSISCTKNKGNVSISFLFYIGLTLTFRSNGFGFKPCMVQITRGGNRLEGERSKRETEVGYLGQPHRGIFCANIKGNVSIPLCFNTLPCHKTSIGVIP